MSITRALSLATLKPAEPKAAYDRYRPARSEAQVVGLGEIASRGEGQMQVTRYFTEQVLRKRPYLTQAMCEEVTRSAIRTEPQTDGRIRHWGRVTLPGGQKTRILRVVTLEDGTTLHNAFIDRDFDEDRP